MTEAFTWGIKNILVFPCGSEIGLELHRALKYSRHINLIGGSSVDDHGRFVYETYVDGIPFATDPDFVPAISRLVQRYGIDAIYPAMDIVIASLAGAEKFLGCRVIGSPREAAMTCCSKRKTYEQLAGILRTPKIYESIDEVDDFPVFMKPDVGYGTRGARRISNKGEALAHFQEYPDSLILEYLPGREFTVDCFTDRKRDLQFVGPRLRRRVLNGISVNTIPTKNDCDRFGELARKINRKMVLRGAWFFQLKEREDGELVLLEIAARIGGSSSLYRNLGVNFALLSIFDAFDEDVVVSVNSFSIEMDRALSNRYKIDLDFDTVYVDLDDTLIVNGQVNADLVGLLYNFLNKGKKLILLTKHTDDAKQTLARWRIDSLFDEIIQIGANENKIDHMKRYRAIFIDDSYAERKRTVERGIPVFSPDACECLADT
jgi:hypothetical protein